MTYAVPLEDGSFGIAQAGSAMGGFVNVIHVALFSYRFPDIPKECPLETAAAVSLASTWRQALNRGDWPSIQVRPQVFGTLEFPNERFAASGYVGSRTHDAGILADFLSAYHGLAPWNVMFDEGYYDQLLRPRIARPEAAIVLSDADRARYRREVMGIDA